MSEAKKYYKVATGAGVFWDASQPENKTLCEGEIKSLTSTKFMRKRFLGGSLIEVKESEYKTYKAKLKTAVATSAEGDEEEDVLQLKAALEDAKILVETATEEKESYRKAHEDTIDKLSKIGDELALKNKALEEEKKLNATLQEKLASGKSGK